MTVDPVWQCPHCPRQIPVDDFLELAKNSHLKNHESRPSGRRSSRGGSGRGIGEAIGDAVEGLIDGIARIFD